MNSKSVRFDNSNKQGTLGGKQQTTQGRSAAPKDDDDYENDDFEDFNSPPKSSTQKNQSQKQSTIQSNQNQTLNSKLNTQQQSQQSQLSKEEKKANFNFEDVKAANQTNKFIIYKFMKKGFSSLSAEDLACTMVNPDFTIDFRKNTGEEWASQYQFKVVERLNNCKFNLQWITKKQSDNGLDPFFQMVREGDISRVVEFLRQQRNAEEVLDSVEFTSKKSPLHIAAGEGHVQMCEFLLHKGAKIDARDKLLRTPLHLACQAGHAVIVKLLLDNNADPYDKDQSGRTAMHYACCSTCVEQLTLLCEDGEDLVHMKDHAGRTPLHYSVFNSMPRQVEMALKLLNLGSDVNALDHDRRTPLHHAAEAGKARLIPLLVQRGATTGTKDSLNGKTPLELACSDHIKELIIVHSSPNYIPKTGDLAQGLSVEGQQMKIEPEPLDIFGMKGQTGQPTRKGPPKINQKSMKSPTKELRGNQGYRGAPGEDYKVQDDYEEQRRSDYYGRDGLGPAKEWEKTKDSYLPYNIRNYQDRLVGFLKRVQEFGVQSYQHVKKPYMFTGSWMEHVRSMDDLMIQINGTTPNEAVMKMFNILFPYDKPLPQGKGDELSLQGFYTGLRSHADENMKDCDPDLLRERLEREAEEERKRLLQTNQVEDIRDLLDLKKQLMALESVNNMHQVTIEEKDRKIKELLEQLQNNQNSKKGFTLESEEQYVNLLKENSDLKIQISQMAEQLDISASRLEQLTQIMENDEQRKLKEMEEMKNFSKLQDLQMQVDDLQKKLVQETERNRALRFKAGQIFMQALEKGATSLNIGKQNKNTEGDYYLSDDEALMRLLQRIEQLGEPGLAQRLRDAGEPGLDTITKTQFVNFLTKIGMMPPDILAIQRIVGFYEGGQPVERLKVPDIMLKIMERAGKRSQVEVETLKTLAQELKSKGYSISDAFAHLDANNSGTITLRELQEALKAMKIEVSKQVLVNILHLFDTNQDNSISLEEFERQMEKYMGGQGRIEIPKVEQIESKIIGKEMAQQLQKDLINEQKQTVKFEDFGFKPFEADEFKKKEQLILDAIKKGQMPEEKISGEIKLQFDEGVNMLSIPNKAIPFISLTIVNYTADGQKAEQKLNSNPCVGFLDNYNFNTAVRIPLIGKDKNKIADAIQVQYYFQSAENEVQMDKASFVGECFLPWKQILTNNSEWLQQRVALTDPLGKCPQKVQGMVKIFAKWIPVGHPDSKYDQDGNKKEAVQQQTVPSKRTQMEGSTGKLEIYLQQYNHPEALPAEKYCIEMQLGTSVNKSVAKDGVNNEIRLADVRTLPVNDIIKDRALTLKLTNSKGIEICKTVIDVQKACYIQPNQMIMLKAQPMNIEGKPEIKGTLQVKLKFIDSKPGDQQQVITPGQPQIKPQIEEEKKQQVITPAQPQVKPKQEEEKKQGPAIVDPKTQVSKQPTQKKPEEFGFQEVKIQGTQDMMDNAGGDFQDEDDFQ